MEEAAKVSFDYHIEVNRHYYSVPYGYVGKSVSVKITESLVQIFHDHQRIAIHERSSVPFQHSTQEGHMPPAHLAHKTNRERPSSSGPRRLDRQRSSK